MIKVDFHHHINTDPLDSHYVKYPIQDLICSAKASGLDAIAITCHESVPYDFKFAFDYAKSRDLLLLHGMEATVDGKHLLLINFDEYPKGVCSLSDVRYAKESSRKPLVISPHPFYPVGIAGADLLIDGADIIDAVEFSGLYTSMTPIFNKRALNFAKSASIPVVGNTDTHFLWQLGRTYTELPISSLSTDNILDSVASGIGTLKTSPLSWKHIIKFVHEAGGTPAFLQDCLSYMTNILKRTKIKSRGT